MVVMLCCYDARLVCWALIVVALICACCCVVCIAIYRWGLWFTVGCGFSVLRLIVLYMMPIHIHCLLVFVCDLLFSVMGGVAAVVYYVVCCHRC